MRRWGGLAGTDNRLYKIWHGMHARCEKPAHTQFNGYGGRGIFVCREWDDFVVFLHWAKSNGHDPRLTIDRIDNDGPYAPENCRWATRKEQARNRRNTTIVGLRGDKKAASAWAEDRGLAAQLVYRRLASGWGADDAINRPAQVTDAHVSAFGQTKRLSEWSRELGIPKDRIYLRLKRGWDAERALSADLWKPLPRPKPTIEINGSRKTVEEWCAEIGISKSSFHRRRREGTDLFARPSGTGPKPGTVYRCKPGPKPAETHP